MCRRGHEEITTEGGWHECNKVIVLVLPKWPSKVEEVRRKEELHLGDGGRGGGGIVGYR